MDKIHIFSFKQIQLLNLFIFLYQDKQNNNKRQSMTIFLVPADSTLVHVLTHS